MQKLSDIVNFDVRIFESDIEKVYMLDKEKFEHSMCHFIAEVTKQKDGSDYPRPTLYQLCTAIQSYLNENGKCWKLIDGPEFKDLKVVLDNL